jgi:hypothetical protein
MVIAVRDDGCFHRGSHGETKDLHDGAPAPGDLGVAQLTGGIAIVRFAQDGDRSGSRSIITREDVVSTSVRRALSAGCVMNVLRLCMKRAHTSHSRATSVGRRP